MNIIPKKESNPHAMSEEDIEALKTNAIHSEIRAIVARRQDRIGPETVALRKVTARLLAEVEALRAVRMLKAEYGELTELDDAKKVIENLHRRNKSLEATAAVKDEEIRRLIGAPAAAVHSDD